jgi:hypothetical protein
VKFSSAKCAGQGIPGTGFQEKTETQEFEDIFFIAAEFFRATLICSVKATMVSSRRSAFNNLIGEHPDASIVLV